MRLERPAARIIAARGCERSGWVSSWIMVRGKSDAASRRCMFARGSSALPFAEPPGRGETGERQRRRENKLARLDSNQEIQYQKLLCCQLHHGPVAGDGGSRAERRRPGKMLLKAARRRHESNDAKSRPAAAAGVDAPVANGEVRGQVPVDWKTDRPRRGPPWMGQATSQPHPVPCWRRTSVDGGQKGSMLIPIGSPALLRFR